MEPYETLGLPSPDECIGIAGLTVGLLAGLLGTVWLLGFQGGLWAFLLVIAGLIVGTVSFMYCETWEGSWPISRRWSERQP